MDTFESELEAGDIPQPGMTLSSNDLKKIAALFADVLGERLGRHGFKKAPSVGAFRTDRYRVRLRAAQGSHTHEQWLDRVAYYGWCCRYCWVELTAETVVKEHAIPLSRGGTNWASNLVPACKPCNSAKKDKTPAEFGSHWRVMR